MGTSVSHLIIYCYNLTREEAVAIGASIDLSVANPHVKAAEIYSKQKIYEEIKWDKKDIIVRVVSVPH